MCLFLLVFSFTPVFLSLWNCPSLYHLPFYPGGGFSMPAPALTLYPTEASIPAFRLTDTHACNGLARRNNYQVEGEGIQRDEERPKACCRQHSKASPKEGRPEGQVGICTACGHHARPRERGGVHNPHGWSRGCFWNTPCTSPDYLMVQELPSLRLFPPSPEPRGKFPVPTHLWAPATRFLSSFCSLPLIQNNFTS